MKNENSNLELAKKLNIAAIVISVILLLVIGGMRQIKLDLGIDFSFLPAFHSSVNALTALVLVAALYFIKQKNIPAHRNMIFLAMGLSVIFLGSYVLYHITTEETKFCREGAIRTVYFFFLITHVILAAVILPFILFTFIRAFTGQIERHRKLARWVWPLWFYVALTGPICYLLLKPCY